MPIHFDVDGAVATITVEGNSPVNAWTWEMREEIFARLCEIDLRPDIRAGVICGAGQHFSAGADLKARAGPNWDRITAITQSQRSGKMWVDENPYYYDDKGRPRESFVHLMRETRTPVVMAVRGWCLGTAFIYGIIHTGVRIAGESARLGLIEIKYGLVGGVSHSRLEGRIPRSALMWLATGQLIDASTALRVGIVNEVVPDDQVMDRAHEVARTIARAPKAAIRGERECLIRAERASAREAAAYASAVASMLCSEPEVADRIAGTGV